MAVKYWSVGLQKKKKKKKDSSWLENAKDDIRYNGGMYAACDYRNV